MAFIIPTTNQFKDYIFTISLDGTVYQLGIRWNSRMEKWFVSLSLEDETPIIGMRPIIADTILFGRFRSLSLPKGQIMSLDTTGTNTDPDEDTLGVSDLLTYLEEADIV